MYEQRAKLTYLAGSMFSKAQELRALLREMAAEGQHQGEIHLTYQPLEGQPERLVIHIDGDEFTMMRDDSTADFRLDLNDSSLHIE